jgi:hypothetical protein
MINFIHTDFKFQHPESWQVDTSKAWGAEVFVFSPLENEEDKFRENLNVLIQDLAGLNIDLEGYKQLTEEQIAMLATDGKIIESSIKTSDKGEFLRITYSMTQGIFNLMITSVCFIHNDKAYLVTFSAEADQLDHYKLTSEQILDSFTLIN